MAETGEGTISGTTGDSARNGTRRVGGKRPRRPPRKTEEIRTLLIDAARAIFGAKGFEAATTQEIADRADVAHTLLFRHFGTKQELFECAVVEPLQAAIAEVLEQWSTYGHEPHSPEMSSRDYVELLYAFFRKNSRLVAALTWSPDYGESGAGDSSLSRMIDVMAEALETEVKVHGWTDIDVPVAMRVAFCATLGITLFDEWVFPRDDRYPGDARIKKELTSYLASGLAGRGLPG